MADRTESRIDIAAAPGAVLDVIADFDRYPEWAGEVKKVAVISEDGDGWADQVEFTLSAGAIKDTYVLEYDWDVAEDGTGVVSWTLVSAQVLKAMNGSYTLEDTILEDTIPEDTILEDTEYVTGDDSDTDSEPGKKRAGTAVTYRLSVDVKIPMLGMLKRKAEQVIIDTALKELKKRVEV
ncbi:MAG: hypothetical protein QOF35_329 [Actinomycetota bacterium]|jgi:hypothetical protein|nr:hypothetical protein [Actinomycetota bacterium]